MIKYNEFWGWIIKLFISFAPPIDIGAKWRGFVYKPFLKKCGKNPMIPWRTYIFNPNKLSIGDNVYMGYNSYYGQGEIEINDNVLIGPFVSITASNHVYDESNSFRNSDYYEDKIIIKEGAWIGAHSCILAGSVIGAGSIVAAGSVVNSDIPDNVLCGGTPAKIIKKLR